MVARGVVAVDSIADLLALPAGQRREGLRYLVKGYYAGSDVGGGEFYWDESDEASPNFGTVLSAPGVATGRFRREYVILTDRHFGVYDGMDAVEARDRIQALVNVGHPE